MVDFILVIINILGLFGFCFLFLGTIALVAYLRDERRNEE